MFSDTSTTAASFAALLMLFVSLGVSGQSTSFIPLVRPYSMSTLSATATSTTSGPSITASVTTMNPTSEATTEAPTATKAPSSKTCGWVGALWKKRWNSTYENNKQFIRNTTEKLQMLMEHGLFNDSSKYGNVTVAELRVNEVDGYVYLSIMLCLVVKRNNTGFIEDVIYMWKKFGNENVTNLEFRTGYFVTFGGLKAKDGECSKCSGPFGVLITLEIECKPKKAEYSCNGLKNSWENDDCVKYCGRRFGVTFGDWKAKDGECSKCSIGGAGPITLERECEPKLPAYSCDGFNTTMESQDCLKYCDSSAANRKFTSVFLLLAVLISFSTSFTIWE